MQLEHCALHSHKINTLQILKHLPAARLRSLEITGSWGAQADDILAPIARLQLLTELRIKEVMPPSQLLALQLPPQLQHLDVCFDLNHNTQQLQHFATWFGQHGAVARRIAFSETVIGPSGISGACGKHHWRHPSDKQQQLLPLLRHQQQQWR
jgi:hypothetical protein